MLLFKKKPTISFLYEGHSINSANSNAFFHWHVGEYYYILIYKAINKCLRIKQACVRSSILAVFIQLKHEGRLISNANAYEGKLNRSKQNKRSTVGKRHPKSSCFKY